MILPLCCQHAVSIGRVASPKSRRNEEAMIINGSCCCGAVRFVIKGAPNTMGTCHCSRCRKLGVSTIVFVKRDQFHLEAGVDAIETVEPTAPYKYHRSFCRHCGTSLGEPRSPDESFPINAHCLDDDPGLRVSFEEFVADRPDWVADTSVANGLQGTPQSSTGETA